MGKQEHRKYGFSMGEVMVTMLLVTIFLAVTAPIITKQVLYSGVNPKTATCIAADAGNSLAVSCVDTIIEAKRNKAASLKSLFYFAGEGSSANQEAALSIISDTCGSGGTESCEYLINRCMNDSNNCDVTDKTYDIYKYLLMDADSTNEGKIYIYQKLKQYLADGIESNFISPITTACADTTNCVDGGCMACKLINSKTYDFNLWERDEFTEEDSGGVPLTVFKGGAVEKAPTSATGGEFKKYYDDTNMDIFHYGLINSDEDLIVSAEWREDASGSQWRQVLLKIDPVTGSVKETYFVTNGATSTLYLGQDSSGNIVTATRGWDYSICSFSNDLTIRNYTLEFQSANSQDCYMRSDELYCLFDLDENRTQLGITKHDVSDGSITWAYEITGISTVDEDINSEIIVDSNGNMYIFANIDGSTDIYGMKISSSFIVDWSFTYSNLDGADQPKDVEFSPDGNIYLLPGEELAILKIDKDNGNILINKKYSEEGSESFYDMTIDSNGYIYIVGTDEHPTDSTNDDESILIKIKENPAGNDFDYSWGLKFGGDHDDFANSIMHDGSNTLFIFGAELATYGADNWGNEDAYIIKMGDDQSANANYTPAVDTGFSPTKSTLSGIGFTLVTSSYSMSDDTMTGNPTYTVDNLDDSLFDGLGFISASATSNAYITTNTNGITGITSKIVSASFTETKPDDTAIYYLVTFDGGTTWKYYKTGVGWTTATVTTLDAYDFTADTTSTSDQLNAQLPNYTFQAGETSFGFAADLQTTHETNVPSIDKIVIQYL